MASGLVEFLLFLKDVFVQVIKLCTDVVSLALLIAAMAIPWRIIPILSTLKVVSLVNTKSS